LPQYETITSIASRLVNIAEENILNNEGYITGSGETKTYHIPDPCAMLVKLKGLTRPGRKGLLVRRFRGDYGDSDGGGSKI